jgi:hypothetical protein
VRPGGAGLAGAPGHVMGQAQGSNRALSDEQVEEAVKLRLDGREQLMSHFGLTSSAARRAEPVIRAIIRERDRTSGADAPRYRKTAGPARDINGKTSGTRVRELKARRKGDHYPALLAVQLRISELCAALGSVKMADYPLDEVSLWRISDIEDDLLTLTAWTDRALSEITARLGDEEIRAKIRIMRDPTGRTPAEAASMQAVAARLERKLRNRLTARA